MYSFINAGVLSKGYKKFVNSGGGSNPYAGLAAGAWQELSNTKIRDQLPGGTTGNPTSIVDAYSGACVDTLRHKLIVWGGGHGDYNGNEVYTIDYTSSPSVSRVFGPTFTTPVSRHTYGGMAYISSTDVMYSVGGATYPDGNKDNTNWEFNLTSNTFTNRGDSGIGTSILGTWVGYDSVTNQVYINNRNDMLTYNASTYAMTNRGGSPDPGSLDMSICLDTTRRRMVVITAGSLTYKLLDSPYTNGTISTSNTPGTVGENCPGFQYDPVGDRFVLWAGGASVYAVSATGGAWSDITTSGGPASAQQASGTYGRWGYDPTYKVMVLCNSIDENLFVFKLASGA